MAIIKQKDEQTVHLFVWQDLGDRNITFADELDFEAPELNTIFEELEG